MADGKGKWAGSGTPAAEPAAATPAAATPTPTPTKVMEVVQPRRKRPRALLAIVLVVVFAAVGFTAYHLGRSRGGGDQLTIWLTGYSWQDNTPPGSSTVGEPVLHKEAGGTGTYADPITVAVPGHKGDMDWQPGTRFYLPTVQRYVIVEDSGAAKPPSGADTHLDMWIGGQDGTKDTTDDCENSLTGDVPAIVNPPEGEAVMSGPIFAAGKCNIPPQHNSGSYSGRDGGGDSDSDSGGSSHHGHHHHHHHHDDN
jgi:hypothetical protein